MGYVYCFSYYSGENTGLSACDNDFSPIFLSHTDECGSAQMFGPTGTFNSYSLDLYGKGD